MLHKSDWPLPSCLTNLWLDAVRVETAWAWGISQAELSGPVLSLSAGGGGGNNHSDFGAQVTGRPSIAHEK